MTRLTYLLLITATTLLLACSSQVKNTTEEQTEAKATEPSPLEMLNEAYQLFKEGDDAASILLATQVLELGRETKNDTLVGRALTSLCRNAQRSLDTTKLAMLSSELEDLAATSGNKQWLMYRAHMNAEMWRLMGDMDRAEDFYTESMKISLALGATGMYTIDHFNKSFVSTAKGDYKTANALIKKYYLLRKEADAKSEDAYGLIALAYLLEQKENYKGAHEVAVVTRRLFKEQNLFPEPPDEKPLLLVEAKVKEVLTTTTLAEISTNSVSASVSSLLDKYLE
ncbi:MAG: tetratricopeptide (TPR) repeat protein [Flavobacteriales bacterium]|jgi:tetratricopeptide (TPR) repeat protein